MVLLLLQHSHFNNHQQITFLEKPGDKRVAFASSAIFLRLNGYRLKLDAAERESSIVNEVIGNKADIETIADWLEDHMYQV